MDFVYDVLVVLHFIGLASLLGGFLVQMKVSERVVNPAMFHGVLTQLVTGLLLVGIAEMQEAEVDHVKVGVKLLVVLVVLALVLANRKRPGIPTGVWAAIGGLTTLNIVIAVFW